MGSWRKDGFVEKGWDRGEGTGSWGRDGIMEKGRDHRGRSWAIAGIMGQGWDHRERITGNGRGCGEGIAPPSHRGKGMVPRSRAHTPEKGLCLGVRAMLGRWDPRRGDGTPQGLVPRQSLACGTRRACPRGPCFTSAQADPSSWRSTEPALAQLHPAPGPQRKQVGGAPEAAGRTAGVAGLWGSPRSRGAPGQARQHWATAVTKYPGLGRANG